MIYNWHIHLYMPSWLYIQTTPCWHIVLQYHHITGTDCNLGRAVFIQYFVLGYHRAKLWKHNSYFQLFITVLIAIQAAPCTLLWNILYELWLVWSIAWIYKPSTSVIDILQPYSPRPHRLYIQARHLLIMVYILHIQVYIYICNAFYLAWEYYHAHQV